MGADMVRNFLQLGYTGARRYANHRGGRKYDPETGKELPRVAALDSGEGEAAAIFKAAWDDCCRAPGAR